MIRIKGKPLPVERLNSHNYVCDLLYADFPAIQLYSDGRESWVRIWCDTDSARTNRWIVIRVSREALQAYLGGEKSLLALIQNTDRLWLLDQRDPIAAVGTRNNGARKAPSRRLQKIGLLQITTYLPTEDSLFDPDLAPDVDLSYEVSPKKFDVKIKGTWFSIDFQDFINRYQQIYAFFYGTHPRFVTRVNDTLHRVLRWPWEGGASRVYMYVQLFQHMPALHTLKVDGVQYGSPGYIRFDALPSIQDAIKQTLKLYASAEKQVESASKAIDKILKDANLKRTDLSTVPDSGVPLSDEKKKDLRISCAQIADCLKLQEEIGMLDSHSPNAVVYSKAVVSFVQQFKKLALYNSNEMLDFDRVD